MAFMLNCLVKSGISIAVRSTPARSFIEQQLDHCRMSILASNNGRVVVSSTSDVDIYSCLNCPRVGLPVRMKRKFTVYFSSGYTSDKSSENPLQPI